MALVQLKKHLAWYSAGLPGSARAAPAALRGDVAGRGRCERFWALWTAVTQRWFEDFPVGDRFGSPSKTLTDAHFMFFAGMTGDAHPIHYDDEYARTRASGGGWPTACC